MPYGKFIDFEYVNQMDKKKLASILLTIIGFVAGIICGTLIFHYNYNSCPEENKCVGKTYHIIPDILKDWSDAVGACQSRNMKLISIESSEEQDRIEKTIKAAGLDTSNFWTSGTRTGNNETFFWVETGNRNRKNITLFNWAKGEPSDFANGEECIELESRTGMKWNDVPCSSGGHNVICEI